MHKYEIFVKICRFCDIIALDTVSLPIIRQASVTKRAAYCEVGGGQ